MDIDILYIFAALNKTNIIQQIKIKMIRDFRNCSNNIIRFEQNQEAGNLPEVKDDNGMASKSNDGHLNEHDAKAIGSVCDCIGKVALCTVFGLAICKGVSLIFSTDDKGNPKVEIN